MKGSGLIDHERLHNPKLFRQAGFYFLGNHPIISFDFAQIISPDSGASGSHDPTSPERNEPSSSGARHPTVKLANPLHDLKPIKASSLAPDVPITLSFSEPNYKKWSRLFLLLVRRFNLEGFLTGEKTSTGKDDVKWLQLDALIQGWILSTVNDEVSDLIISSTTSAADLWKSIHNLFHDNMAARAMQLEQQFFNTVKRTSTIATYCQTLRNIADWLDDVDAPVTENQLVLQTLRGLPEDLSNQASFLQFQKPPPTFMETRPALLLLEGQRRPAAGEGSTALAAHGGGGPRGPGFGGHGGQHLGLSSGSNGPAQTYGGRGQSHGGRSGRPTRGRGRGRNVGTPSRHFSGQFSPWQITYPSH
ncbi:unnamed protein product [Cuscuta campestris]|uniref:Retrotransposon Copia-like N-terminal domain-containing protein n=1 Tax=Cuscuta campestris TaxID=132261 RepID=A0A484MJJ8_9ASTE|nr:unnamed protein product [Cuscuta campestris]